MDNNKKLIKSDDLKIKQEKEERIFISNKSRNLRKNKEDRKPNDFSALNLSVNEYPQENSQNNFQNKFLNVTEENNLSNHKIIARR